MSQDSSRDRLLAALSCAPTDSVPCCFMLFQALQRQSPDDFVFFNRQIDLGLDVRVELPDVPMHFAPGVTMRTWAERAEGEPAPRLRKRYVTPAGTIETLVRQTVDWPHGQDVPLFDDYLAPRTIQPLIRAPSDMAALRMLLAPPSHSEIAEFREMASKYQQYAADKGLLLSGGWRDWRSNPVQVVGQQGGAMLGIDALMWLCGGTASLYWAFDQPEFLAELIAIIGAWDEQRLGLMLDAGAELIIERAWYSGTEFWSPRLYRKFIAPMLRRKIAMTHQAGAKFGYIMTSGIMPLVDDLIGLGIDVLIGVDPVQGKGTNLDQLTATVSGRMCVWGGVSAPMSVEQAETTEVWRAVENALAKCGRRGGFILSPVDNVLDTSNRAWENVLEFIKAWKALAVGFRDKRPALDESFTS